jgi:hypothetical protein
MGRLSDAAIVMLAIAFAFGVIGFSLGLYAYIIATRARRDVQRLALTLLGVGTRYAPPPPGPGEQSEGSADAF